MPPATRQVAPMVYARDATMAGEISLVDAQWTSPKVRRGMVCTRAVRRVLVGGRR
jgi:hypothetical protein